MLLMDKCQIILDINSFVSIWFRSFMLSCRKSQLHIKQLNSVVQQLARKQNKLHFYWKSTGVKTYYFASIQFHSGRGTIIYSTRRKAAFKGTT